MADTPNFCTQYGSPLEKEQNFCTHCGHTVEATAVMPAVASTTVASTTTTLAQQS